ncbi:MAG: hypothetical protein CM1200mP36_00960 [Gammaproteobacteria bacterium]|nr:MAG: hypothetical protein CM1200mP36_00960 [Gammaproteobacteria bacterium]
MRFFGENPFLLKGPQPLHNDGCGYHGAGDDGQHQPAAGLHDLQHVVPKKLTDRPANYSVPALSPQTARTKEQKYGIKPRDYVCANTDVKREERYDHRSLVPIGKQQRGRLERRIFAWLLPTFIAGCGNEPSIDPDNTNDLRPNVILIVADDMGYNELGAWGSEIATPNLDELALGGFSIYELSRRTKLCTGTRHVAVRQTPNHQAGIGSMAIKRAYDSSRELDPNTLGLGHPGYEGHLSERVAALPEILRSAGYHIT